MKGIAVVQPKGGVGKTTICHLLAVGAAWRQVPAYLLHTDDRSPMQVDGRPYAYLDAREPETLRTLMSSLINNDGLCIVDGGGNRPGFDTWIGEAVDLVLIPVVADTESVTLARETMNRLESNGVSHARYLLNMVSSNTHSRTFDAAHFFDRLEPERIAGQVKRVDAVKRLGMPDNHAPFPTPPSHVNALARHLYRLVVRTTSELSESAVA